ncbi:RHS repeat-associated core domain-containing protein, partial [Acetivibrio mesophilus]
TYYYDAFGNIEEEKYYDANGNLTTTPINNNIRYAGYQYDEETGLYYLNARMYDPKIARFLQEDTYKGDPNDPLSLNLYVYCRNNPIMYDDPSGHFWHVVGAALLGAVVSAAIDVGTQMIFERKSFKDINWKSVGVSALEGAISGAIASVTGGVSLAAAAGKGAVKTTGKQILKKAVQTAVVEGVVGAAANATAQKIVNNDVDWNEVAISGVADAISGGVGSALSDIKVGKKLLDAGKKVKQKVGDFVSSVGDSIKNQVDNISRQIDNVFSPKLAVAGGIDVDINYPNNLVKNTGGVPKTQTQIEYNNAIENFKAKQSVDVNAGVGKGGKSQVVINNEVGNSFDTYVEGTKLKGVTEKGLLETQETFPVKNLGQKSVKPDYSIYNTNGELSAIGDAKSGAIVFDDQAKGFVQVAAQQTTSKTVIYYTPLGNTPIPRELMAYAAQNNVKIIQVGVK